MIQHINEIAVSASAIKALLLLLGLDFTPNLQFEKFISQFKVKYNVSKHSKIKFIFNEFDKQITILKKELNDRTPHKKENGDLLTLLEGYNQIEGYKIRLQKLEQMILLQEYNGKNSKSTGLFVSNNLHKATGVYYVVCRSLWLDNEGNKYRKFSKNLGNSKNLLVDNKIPEYKLTEAIEDLTMMMWEQYKLEYKVS